MTLIWRFANLAYCCFLTNLVVLFLDVGICSDSSGACGFFSIYVFQVHVRIVLPVLDVCLVVSNKHVMQIMLLYLSIVIMVKLVGLTVSPWWWTDKTNLDLLWLIKWVFFKKMNKPTHMMKFSLWVLLVCIRFIKMWYNHIYSTLRWKHIY